MEQHDRIALKAFEDELNDVVNGNHTALKHDGHFFDAAWALINDPTTPASASCHLMDAINKMREAYNALEEVADLLMTARESMDNLELEEHGHAA